MKRTAIVTVVILVLGSVVAWLIRNESLPGIPSLINREPPGLSFAVIGDTESNTELYTQALTSAKQLGAAFIIHAGDLTDNGTEDEFRAITDVETGVGLPVYAAIGNHDTRTDASGAFFSQYANAKNFAVEVDGVRFVFLDNEDRTAGFSDETLAWLDREFSEHPDARYVLTYHRPFDLPFSDVTGDDETSASRASNKRFLGLIDGKNIAAVFSGHLHAYVPYHVSNIPAYVTGGGGGSQGTLGNLLSTDHHFLMVRLTGTTVAVEMLKLD